MNCCKEKKESLAAARRLEIIRACEELYEAVDYDAISIKEIAKSTSICRSNIYNYYETKEEIFLDILKKEYLLWMEDMKKLLEEDSLRSRSSYCRIIARTARHRPRLLKLISVHYVSIEKNCSLERLTDFKKSMEPFWNMFRESLTVYFPNSSSEKRETFILLAMSLVQGIYSMTSLSEKQLCAMKCANPGYTQPDFEDTFYQALYTLTSELL